MPLYYFLLIDLNAEYLVWFRLNQGSLAEGCEEALPSIIYLRTISQVTKPQSFGDSET